MNIYIYVCVCVCVCVRVHVYIFNLLCYAISRLILEVKPFPNSLMQDYIYHVLSSNVSPSFAKYLRIIQMMAVFMITYSQNHRLLVVKM